MAKKYATGFPAASAVNLTDHFQVVQSGVDADATIAQLLALAFPFVDVTDASMGTLMQPNTTYFAHNNIDFIELDLPTNALQNDFVEIIWKGSAGYQVTPNGGQTILFGDAMATGGFPLIPVGTNINCKLKSLDDTSNNWTVVSSTGDMQINFNVNNAINSLQRLDAGSPVTFTGLTMPSGSISLFAGVTFAQGPFGLFDSTMMSLTSNGSPDARGFLVPPMSTANRLSIGSGSPDAPIIVFDTTLSQWMGWNNTAWVVLG